MNMFIHIITRPSESLALSSMYLFVGGGATDAEAHAHVHAVISSTRTIISPLLVGGATGGATYAEAPANVHAVINSTIIATF